MRMRQAKQPRVETGSTRNPARAKPPVRAKLPARGHSSDAAKTSRGAATRDRIVLAARAAAVAHGLADWTLRGVAVRSGVSLGNLQFHFANRDALLCAVLQAELENAEAFVARHIEGAEDPIAAAIDALLAIQHQRGTARLFYSLWTVATTSPSVRAALHAYYAAWIARVTSFAPEAKDRAWLFIALLEGASLFRCSIAGELNAAQERELRERLRELLGAPSKQLEKPGRPEVRSRKRAHGPERSLTRNAPRPL